MLFNKRLLICLAILTTMVFVSCRYYKNVSTMANDLSDTDFLVQQDEFTETFFNINKQEDEFMVAVWVSYLDISGLLSDMSKESFEQNLDEMIENLKSIGATDIFFHVRAFGDAFYNSKIVPSAFGVTYPEKQNDVDYFRIVVEKCKKNNIKIHAWLNPFRLSSSAAEQNVDYINSLKTEYGEIVATVEQRSFINPSSNHSDAIFSEIVLEIIENYDIDGVHIDDYFYPTTDENFDNMFFDAENSSRTIGDFRRERISSIIEKVYDDIKAFNKDIVFGISPDGSIERNFNTHYLDISGMQAVANYSDYFAPQIYYGFLNETSPFEAILKEWQDIVKIKDLIIGIAFYKVGVQDEFAGKGVDEWKVDQDIIVRQIDMVRKAGCEGIAFFRYDSLFNPENEVEAVVLETLNSVKVALNEK